MLLCWCASRCACIWKTFQRSKVGQGSHLSLSNPWSWYVAHVTKAIPWIWCVLLITSCCVLLSGQAWSCSSICWRFAHLVNDWKRPRDVPVTMTEEDKIRMTADLTILVFAQGIDTIQGAWPVGTGCLPTQSLKSSVKRRSKRWWPWWTSHGDDNENDDGCHGRAQRWEEWWPKANQCNARVTTAKSQKR